MHTFGLGVAPRAAVLNRIQRVAKYCPRLGVSLGASLVKLFSQLLSARRNGLLLGKRVCGCLRRLLGCPLLRIAVGCQGEVWGDGKFD